MVFNKLPKEMRRTLALTLAASMVATGTQTPVLADQVQEVSVQEVQNAQTEAGEEQNVQAAEQQEEVPVAEEQTGTVGQAEAEESVEENLDDTVSANTMASINNKTADTEDLDAEEVIDEEINVDMAAEANNATYVEIAVTSGNEENGKLSCGFEFNKTTMTARLVKIVPAKEAVNRPKFAEDADEKDKRVTLKLDQVNDDDGNVYTVTSIYNDAGICGTNIPLMDLVIGANVATIGKNAFRNNPVRSLTFEAGSGLSEIGDYAFSTSYLEDDIVIPQKVKSIGEGAFQGTACTNVRFAANTVTTSVGKSAFASCTKLQTVSGFPAGVTKVPDSCFSGDSELKKVEYANIAAVTEIGKSAFMKCKRLEADAAYNPIGENVTSIGASAFAECGSTYKNATEDYTCFTEITIPAGVTKLEASTFANCTTLKKVTFADENSVVEIGDSCFGGDTALTICELPAQLEKLGNASFSKTALTSVRIPATLKIANSPFAECQKIKSIQWGTETAKVTKVVDTLFQNLKSAIEVDFANQITEIGASAFASSSITGVNGTGKVETVKEKGFMNCNTLVGEVSMPALTQIYAYAFSGVGATDFIISNDVTVIDEGAFAKCSNLKSMNIAAGVADVDLGNMTKLGQIGKNAFSGCQAIVSLQLPGTVTKIEEGAFSGLTALANVKFKNNGKKGTTTIGTSAFSGCTNLVDVETASNVGVIDNKAFSGCVKLMRLKLADGLQTIGNSAFAGCKRLEGALPDGVEEEYEIVEEKRVKLPNPNAQLVIPESVTTIGDMAFANCYNDDETHTPEGGSEKVYKIGIKAVHIAGNLAGTTIGASAFAVCQNLTKLTLGEGVTGLGDSALEDTRLEEITIPSTFKTGTAKNSPFTSGENSTLKKVTFADGIEVIPQYFLNNITTLTKIEIPASVQNIGDHAFADCSNLETVTFKEQATSNLTTIDTSAFEGCSLMKLSALPEGVTTINASAFKDCKKISLTEFPTGLITIGKAAFEGCTGLTSVQIDGGEKKQTTIADGAFATCENLNRVIINNIKSVGKKAFTNLPISILDINQVDTIGESAFKDNKALKEINLDTIKTVSQEAFRGCGVADDGTDPATLTLNNVNAIGSLAFYGCGFKTVQIPHQLTSVTTGKIDGVEYGPFAGGKLETVSFGTLINTIPDNLCMNTTSLQKIELQSVKASLKTIGKNAFKGCTSVEEVTIPQGISTVSNSAFEGCSGLTDVTIAAKTINAKAFAECTNLKAVQMEEGVTTIQGMAFANTQISAVTIPSTLTTAGTTKEGTIEKGPFAGTMIATVHGQTGDSTEAQEGATILPETKKIPDNLFLGCTSIIDVQIPETVTEIGQKAFKDASSVENVTFAVNTETGKVKGVEKIGISAFDGCNSLQELVLPETVTEVLQGAFANEGALVKADMSRAASLKKWEKESFKGDTALAEVVLPTASGITAIPDGAFAGCTSLTGENLKIPKNIVTITANAFKESGLKKLYIPNQVTTIGTSAFEACKNLEDVHISNNITIINQNTFKNCEKLEKIEIPVKVAKIGTNAFYGSGLKDVYIFGDPEIGGGITNTYAGMKNQLSVFEKEVVDETASAVSQHIFNADFTIHGAENTKLKTAFFDTYRTETDGPSVPNVADGKGTIAIYSTSLTNTDQPCMKWDSLDEATYKAAAIKLEQSELTMMLKNKKTLVASVVPADETKEDSVLDALTWESSDEKIAKVDANGVITANAEGTVTITAKAGDVKAECKVKVITPIDTCVMQKEGGTGSLTSLALRGGESIAVTFDVKKSNKQASDEYTVKAGDASVISVEKKDKSSNIYVITALKKGKTSIICSATDGSEFTKAFDVAVDSTQYIVKDPTKFTNNNEDGSHNYEANTKDSWTYHVDGVSEIKIAFDPVTEVETDHDFILVYDKDGKSLLYDGDTAANGVATVVTEDGTVQYKYTGDQLDDRIFTVKGDTVRVQIDADASGERYGFKISKVVTQNTIDYKLNGGSAKNNPNPYSFSSDRTEPIILKDATREDATFAGWYTDKACTIPITEIKPGIGGVTVYAKWLENPAVIYKLNGAPDSINTENPKYVPYDNEAAIPLKALTREGYTFLGWYTDKECTEQIAEIPAHTTEAITVYAKWEKKEIPVDPTPSEDPVDPTPTPAPVIPTPSPSPSPAPSETPSQTPDAAKPSQTPSVSKPAESGTQLSEAEAGAAYTVISADEKQPTVAYTAPADKNVKKVTIPDTITVGGITYKVESIGANAFIGCKNLTNVKIPAGITRIGKNAFKGCGKLSSVTIGKDVTEIGDGAFANCKALKKITISANVTKIGKKAFNKCKALKTITIKTKKLTKVGSAAFKGIAKKAVIKLPKAKKTAYTKLLKKKYDKTTKLK